MPKRTLFISKKGTVTIECDSCGKQNFMKRKNMDDEMWRDLTYNHGVYCSNCEMNRKSKEPRTSYLICEFYTIYADVISLEHLLGIKRAREILERIEY